MPRETPRWAANARLDGRASPGASTAVADQARGARRRAGPAMRTVARSRLRGSVISGVLRMSARILDHRKMDGSGSGDRPVSRPAWNAMTTTTGSPLVKRGLADMLKGGVIMDVVTPEQARIAEDAGAVAVMALERVPADIRAQGGVARMSDPDLISAIIDDRLDPGDGQGPDRALRRGPGAAVPEGRLHRRVRGALPRRLRQPHRQARVHRARSCAARPTWARRCAASPRARR